MSIWFGLPIIVAIIVAAVVISYFIQTVSAEILAYIGFTSLMLQIGATVEIFLLLLISYFISTWIIEMVLKRIADISHPMYHEALKLYQISFPYHEQREEPSQDEIIKDKEYHFSLIYDEEVFVGLILYWEHEEFIYIEHFCILPEMRNKQYGQKTLALLTKRGKKIILEIGPPKDSISKRRKGFYERCGFIENDYPHIHLPYHKENEGHHLVIMTYPKQLSEDMFDTFSNYLKNKVMKNV